MSAEQVIRTYLRAKDENRPHLLRRAFAQDARLEIRGRAEQMRFPPATVGIEAIADVLVRRFNQTFENIYTFCLDRPPPGAGAFACDWLVGMTEKESKSVRVGCGRYEWSFRSEPVFLADGLLIDIEVMLQLDSAAAAAVMDRLAALDYPWASAAAVAHFLPLDELRPVGRFLGRAEAMPGR